jgi:hypothetical protein
MMVAACVVSNVGEIAASSEERSTSMKSTISCLDQAARKLDDHISDAATVAHGVTAAAKPFLSLKTRQALTYI